MTSGDFPDGTISTSVDVLVDFWNEEMNQAVDTITPKHSVLGLRAQVAACILGGCGQ